MSHNKIKDQYSNPAVTFTQNVNISAISPPEHFSSIVRDNESNKVVVTFDQDISANDASGTDFTVKVAGSDATITTIVLELLFKISSIT